MQSAVKPRSVVIIGGGISGLAAARDLYNSRICDVLVLEAENRLGGRIHSINFHDEVIDLGAQWVHGTVGNSVYKLVECELDDSGIVKRYSPSKGYNLLTESGRSVTSKVRRMFDWIPEMFSTLDGRCKRIIEDPGSSEDSVMNTSPQGLFDEIWRKKMTEIRTDSEDDVQSTYAAVRKSALQSLCEADAANSLAQVNLYQYYSYKEVEGPDYILPNGFSAVIDKLIDGLPRSTFKLNCKVDCIFWKTNSNGMNRTVKTDDSPVIVKYSNAKKQTQMIQADHVIVTVSLGCLEKHAKTLFTPSLPNCKQQSIKSLGFGNDGKIFLYYEKPFWRPGEFPLYLLWDEDENRDENDNPENDWIRSIRQFSPWKNDSSRILFSWIFGSNVEEIQKLSAKEVGKKMTEILRKFKKDESIPDPDDVKVSGWSNDPNFYGSYTYLPLGSSERDFENLAEPLCVNNIPRVLFAGEATHSQYYSSSHGAFDSGMREAKRILDFYKT